MNQLRIALLFLLGVTTPGQTEQQKPTLFRKPTVGRTHVVFSYAGDLWIASREGGEAKRLTSMPGEETHPVFSPDGTQVAFTSEAGGDSDVYVVPAAGGEARRLTYHPAWEWHGVVGWTPDGKSVVGYNQERLFSVPAVGGPAEELPLPTAAYGSFSPDGKRIAYVPFPSQRLNFDGFWKGYRGGATSRIWIAQLPDCHIEKIPRDNSNDSNPMWVGKRIYFLSDRNGPITLFAYDTGTKKVSEIIHHPESDIVSASAGPGAIVYETFGSLHLFNLQMNKSHRLSILVSGELPETKPRSVKALDNLAGMRLSATGDRVFVEARGELLTVPSGQGEMQNLTNTPGVRERFPAPSPDGKQLAYFSDASGEYALHVHNLDGAGEVKRIDLGQPPGFFFSPVWSPDSKKIAYRDHRLSLWYVDVERGSPVRIDTDTGTPHERIPVRIEEAPPAWSPDSRRLSYTKVLRSNMRALCIYSLETGEGRTVIEGMGSISLPQFDRSGDYLYFGASTDVGPTQGDDLSMWNLTPTRRVYAAVLRKGLGLPTTPAREAGGPVVIDFDRLADRIVALPIPARNYARLLAGKPGVLFLLEAAGFSIRAIQPLSSRPLSVYRFDLATKKTETVVEGIRDLDLSRDGERMLYRRAQKWTISPTAAPLKPAEGVLQLDSLQVRIDPPAEWKQMYCEVWRSIRDFFYDPGFHGLDLRAREKKFEPYLEGVASSADLNYLFREMVSELRASHMGARAGRGPWRPTARTGLLGADYVVAEGRYRFARIYAGDRWDPGEWAPLAQPGLDVKEGDYLLAVDGREVRASESIHRFFEGKAWKEVVLRIADDAAGARTREVTVSPTDYESGLRRFAWVDENRRKVDRLTGGRVAYVYLPDSGSAGFAAFNRYFSAQTDKEAVIVDGRFSTGGVLPDYYVQRLGQQALGLVVTREGRGFTTPYSLIRGPKVMITNEFSACSGDVLAYLFKRAGLGPLIGTRTEGLLFGPSTLTLMDGGGVRVPGSALSTPEGRWLAENEGIAPDIEVEQDPAAVRAGHDPQLEKAVEVILTLLKKNPPPAIKRPPYKRLQ